jgi:hypothetical protein
VTMMVPSPFPPFVLLGTSQWWHTISLSSFFFCEKDDNNTVCHHRPFLVLSCKSVRRKTMRSAQLLIVFFLFVLFLWCFCKRKKWRQVTMLLISILVLSCKNV